MPALGYRKIGPPRPTKPCCGCGAEHSEKQKNRRGEPILAAYCVSCRRALGKQRRINNQSKGLCYCGKPLVSSTRCQDCLDNEKTYRTRCRDEVLEHYGAACFCCKEWRREFLTVDHIFGGGTQHKKDRKRDIYIWLVKNKFPKGYRTACFNCNCSRGRCGYCPHERENEI